MKTREEEMKNIVAWIEIPVVDFQRAVDFYRSILKVEFDIADFGEEKMACFSTGEGALSYSKGFTPSKNGSLVSFKTESIRDALEEIERQGCEILVPKTKIEAKNRGYFSIFVDSEGNRVGLYQD